MSTHRCSSTGCLRDATVVPTLLLWAAGHRKADHQPLEMTMMVPLCDACAAHFEPSNFTTLQEGRDKIEAAVARAGRARPDWTTAELKLSPIANFPLQDQLPGKMGAA